jgi:hypothetical protein
MGCSGCRKKRANLRERVAEKRKELQKIANDTRTPRQKRIDERNARIKARNERVAKRNSK